MKNIKSWGWIITLIVFLAGGIFGYGMLNEKVNNNTVNIHRNEMERNKIFREIKNEITIIRQDCSIMRGDIQEIKGYLKGKKNGTDTTR